MTLRVLTLAALVALATGCVSTSEFEALQSRVANAEQQANEALDLARQAQSAASSAARNDSTAQQTADRALQAAQEATERVNRISNTCCARK